MADAPKSHRGRYVYAAALGLAAGTIGAAHGLVYVAMAADCGPAGVAAAWCLTFGGALGACVLVFRLVLHG